jgi:hypothetical protein
MGACGKLALAAKLELARSFVSLQQDKHAAELERTRAEHATSVNRVEFDPTVLGLLAVPAPEVQLARPDTARLDCLSGSWSLRELSKVNAERLAAARSHDAEAQAVREGREQKRAAEAQLHSRRGLRDATRRALAARRRARCKRPCPVQQDQRERPRLHQARVRRSQERRGGRVRHRCSVGFGVHRGFRAGRGLGQRGHKRHGRLERLAS